MIAMCSVHFKEKLQSEVSLLAAALHIEVGKNEHGLCHTLVDVGIQ